MRVNKTPRGFSIINFEDRYGSVCSLQKSSLATEDCIWFGVDDPNSQIMASRAKEYGVDCEETVGWVPYPIPDEVSLTTRMHLTKKQVRDLLPALIKFARSGNI